MTVSDRYAADFIVVGAGSAGCVIASRLAEAGNRVTLIDQGRNNRAPSVRIPGLIRSNFRRPSPYMRWYKTVPQLGLGGRIVEHPRGIGVGGSSLVNGMIFLRGNPADYDTWAKMGALGWSFHDVLASFRSMEDCAVGTSALRGRTGPVRVTTQSTLNPLSEAFLQAGRQARHPFTDDVNG